MENRGSEYGNRELNVMQMMMTTTMMVTMIMKIMRYVPTQTLPALQL